MPPSPRLQFGDCTISTEIGKFGSDELLMFLDVSPNDSTFESETVSIGWNSRRTKFAVYVNGQQVFPAPELDPTVIIDALMELRLEQEQSKLTSSASNPTTQETTP